MKIVITSKKSLVDDIKGRLPKDTVVDLPDHKAMFYIERGEAVRYETKVLQDNPLKTDGAEAQLSVAPQVEASHKPTLTRLKDGATKIRGRKKQS